MDRDSGPPGLSEARRRGNANLQSGGDHTMRNHIRNCLSAAAVAGLGLAAWSGAASAAEWKFAIEEIQGSVQDRYAQEFKRRTEDKSGGKIKVTVYPYGTLGTSAELTELVTTGAIQLANASPGHLGTLVPEIQVFSLTYLLSQNNEANKMVLTSSPTIYEDLGKNFEKKELKLLTMYPEGEMVWTTNKEIRKPEDFKNFKMRVMVSPMLVAAYEAFGASPTPLPYGEVYGGLQLKQIDGQVNPIFAIEEMKFYEVSDYMIWAGQQQFTTTVVTNADWYAELPDDQKKLLDEVIAELNDFIFEVQQQYNEERLEKIKQVKPELKMIRLSEAEQAVFREASMQARDRFVDMVGARGKEILDALIAEIAEAEKKVGAR
jgi:tripartite ATP-independent transporter DctP family solute receptor